MAQKLPGFMLKKLLDYSMALSEKGKPLHFLRPLIVANDNFFYEAPLNTRHAPHIRDAVDMKRWMILVVFALLPCILMAIWNTGLQKLVYASGDFRIMDDYLLSSAGLDTYFQFVAKDNRYLTIIKEGMLAFLPIMLISYIVGGFWEALFACIRKRDLTEGFLVTGILYPLILPPTIPYWMVALGVSVGVVFGKELFGGFGRNILNPALTCACFLFFAFPNAMTGNVWVGTDASVIQKSLSTMNQDANFTNDYDGYTQATPLADFHVTTAIKKIHVDAIASNNLGLHIDTSQTVNDQFDKWNRLGNHQAKLGELTSEELKSFVTASPENGGLDLSAENYSKAYRLAGLNYDIGHHDNGNLLWGNRLGSMGETSVIACLLGAFYLIYTGVGSWRTMVSVGFFALLAACGFEFFSTVFASDHGAWNPAKYTFPAYKHLLLGGLWFGMVFMATDPVSSPSTNIGKWIYGAFIGVVTILIRVLNPAYPEGIMLAILMGNLLSPLIDRFAVWRLRQPFYSHS